VVVQNAVGGAPTPDDAATWADGLALTFPVLADPTGSFFATWDPAGVLPVTTIIDADGVITWTEAGGVDSLDAIEAEITALLADE